MANKRREVGRPPVIIPVPCWGAVMQLLNDGGRTDVCIKAPGMVFQVRIPDQDMRLIRDAINQLLGNDEEEPDESVKGGASG